MAPCSIKPTPTPWNCLRKYPAGPLSIGSGKWATSRVFATIHVQLSSPAIRKGNAILGIGTEPNMDDRSESQIFTANDLRELSAFCNELADQLDAG